MFAYFCGGLKNVFFSYSFGAPLKYLEVRSDIEIWLINYLKGKFQKRMLDLYTKN